MPAPKKGDYVEWRGYESDCITKWRLLDGPIHAKNPHSYCNFRAIFVGCEPPDARCGYTAGQESFVKFRDCADVEGSDWRYSLDPFVQWIQDVRADAEASTTD